MRDAIIPAIRGVAQPGRVLALGARCRMFKSCRPDQNPPPQKKYALCLFSVSIAWNNVAKFGDLGLV